MKSKFFEFLIDVGFYRSKVLNIPFISCWKMQMYHNIMTTNFLTILDSFLEVLRRERVKEKPQTHLLI